MRQKTVIIFTLITFFLTSSPLRAQDDLMENKTRSDKIDWQLTDASMKKTATAMIMWGIIIPIVITILSIGIDSSNATQTSTNSTSSL
jgi:hypothetical protein